MRQTLTSVTLATALLMTGCAGKTIGSIDLTKADPDASGIIYALPRGLLKITVSLTDKEVLTFNSEAIVVPDANRRYLSKFLPSAFAEDTIEVVVDANGLLDTSTVISEDKTPEIIKKLAELVARTGLSPAAFLKAGAAPEPFAIESVVDPFDPSSVKNFNGQLEKLSRGNFAIKVSSNPVGNITPNPDSNDGFPVDCTRSLCFRVPVPVFVTLRTGEKHSRTDFATRQVNLPDPSFIGGVNITRAPCIKKTTTLDFTSGMLTKHKIEKPSEILNCLSIPAAVLDALVGGAVKRLTDRTQVSEAEDKYLKAQMSLVATQQKLLENQAAAQVVVGQQQVLQNQVAVSQD